MSNLLKKAKPVKSKAVSGSTKRKLSSRKKAILSLTAIAIISVIVGIFGPQFYRQNIKGLSAKAAANSTYLKAGECLSRGQAIYSSTNITIKRAQFVMQTDGNLVLYDVKGKPVWHSSALGALGSYACMQSDGNFVLYNSSWQPTWHTYTHGIKIQNGQTFVIGFMTEGSSNIKLTSTTASSLVNGYRSNNLGVGTYWTNNYGSNLYTKGAGPEYRSNEIMPRGSKLVSPNGKYKMVYQTDGHLVIYNAANQAIWWNSNWNGTFLGWTVNYAHAFGIGNTTGVGADRIEALTWTAPSRLGNGAMISQLSMQDDGNLVAYDQNWQWMWATWTNGK